VKIHDVAQGSDEWRELRAGIPTASNASRIVTAGLKVSAASRKYVCWLIAESIIGPCDECDTKFMQRGSDMEAEAIRWYEWDQDVKVKRVGFITVDDGTFGCSPDGLVGDDGGLEIKCPGAGVHVENILGMSTQYMPQVQACMWVCERDWWDLLSFNPRMPRVIVRVKRDDEYISRLRAALDVFIPSLAEKREEVLAQLGSWRPIEDQAKETDAGT
jgi:hypothetical protein